MASIETLYPKLTFNKWDLIYKGKMHQKPSTIIIGIDPGTRITGYGIIKVTAGKTEVIDYGCIRPPSSKKLTHRYRLIFEALAELLDLHMPFALAVETQYVHKNVNSALKLGMARGCAILAATLREIPVFEYAPSKAKLAVLGKGRGGKAQVQWMVKHLLGLSSLPEPEDAADALALAICHAHTLKQGLDTKFQI